MQVIGITENLDINQLAPRIHQNAKAQYEIAVVRYFIPSGWFNLGVAFNSGQAIGLIRNFPYQPESYREGSHETLTIA
jgi:hypothetical protein